MSTKFGVCFCPNECVVKQIVTVTKNDVTNLLIFDSYEDAFKNYISRFIALEENFYTYSLSDLWLVWIVDNSIIQFDQLSWNKFTRCIKELF